MMNENNIIRTKAIADRIRELRISSGYKSYETFAVDLDISRRYYWRIEKGCNFTLDTLLKITDAHKITLEEFFKGLK